MKVDLGDCITVKNVYGEVVTGEIEKIYKHSFILLSGTKPHVIRKKDLLLQGDSLARTGKRAGDYGSQLIS